MRDRQLILLGLTATIAGVAACSPDRDVAAPALTFTPEQDPTAPADDHADASVEGGLIRVAGRIATPDPCHQLSATVRQNLDTIALSIEAKRTAVEACFTVIAGLRYSAAIRPTDPGTFVLIVTHGVRRSDGQLLQTHTFPAQRLTVR